MKVLNLLKKKMLGKGSDPGNQPSNYIFLYFISSNPNLIFLATHSFTLLLFPAKMNFWIREVRNNGTVVNYYSSTCDATL